MDIWVCILSLNPMYIDCHIQNVTISEAHIRGGQKHNDIFLNWASIVLGLDRAEDAGGSSQCPHLCWEGLGQVW